MKNNNFTSLIIVLIVCIAGIGILDVLISRQAGESARIAGEVQSGEQRDDHATQLTSDWERIRPRVRDVQSLLPDDATFPFFVEYLESTARASGVTIQPDFDTTLVHALPKSLSTPDAKNTDSSQTKTDQTSTGKPTIIFALDGTGPIGGIESLYSALESSPYFLQIDSAILTTADGLDKPAHVSIILTLYVDALLTR